MHYSTLLYFAGSIIVKPTIVESQLLRAGASKGSLSSHVLSKYRASLEACFEEDEMKEYAKKEHSYAVQNQKEYSLRHPYGEFRSTYAYGLENDVSRGTLPEWLTDRRGVNHGFPLRDNNSYDRFEYNTHGRQSYEQERRKEEKAIYFPNKRNAATQETGWWYSKKKEYGSGGGGRRGEWHDTDADRSTYRSDPQGRDAAHWWQ
jgi:hypothetical protein